VGRNCIRRARTMDKPKHGQGRLKERESPRQRISGHEKKNSAYCPFRRLHPRCFLQNGSQQLERSSFIQIPYDGMFRCRGRNDHTAVVGCRPSSGKPVWLGKIIEAWRCSLLKQTLIPLELQETMALKSVLAGSCKWAQD
jgi:hypothetical protein